MKTRAERIREKKASAEVRTAPLPMAPEGVMVHCDECGLDAPAEECTTRSDGFSECPGCGAPAKLDAGSKKAEPASAVKDPYRKFCGECGREWVVSYDKFIITCGHNHAERVDDPRKAKSPEVPPAGLQTRHAKHVEELDAKAKDLKAPPARVRASAGAGPGPVAVSGNRLSIPWGEARFPVDQWNYFKVGGHIVTVEVPEGEDRVAVAEKVIDDLERVAEMLLARQRAWYLKKLGKSDDE